MGACVGAAVRGAEGAAGRAMMRSIGRVGALRAQAARRGVAGMQLVPSPLARRDEEQAAPGAAAQLSTLSREQIKKNRPVSPHIMIYSFPVAALSSGAMRFTGVGLAVGMYGVGLGALFGGDMSGAMACLGSSGMGPLVKLGVSFTGLYHSAAAYRHLYWEKSPEGLNPKSQTQSSLALFAGAGVLSVISMLV